MTRSNVPARIQKQNHDHNSHELPECAPWTDPNRSNMPCARKVRGCEEPLENHKKASPSNVDFFCSSRMIDQRSSRSDRRPRCSVVRHPVSPAGAVRQGRNWGAILGPHPPRTTAVALLRLRLPAWPAGRSLPWRRWPHHARTRAGMVPRHTPRGSVLEGMRRRPAGSVVDERTAIWRLHAITRARVRIRTTHVLLAEFEERLLRHGRPGPIRGGWPASIRKRLRSRPRAVL